MFTVRLKLSDQIANEQAHWLAEGLVNTALSSAALREGGKYNGSWTLEWIMEEKPDPSTIIARLSLQAAAYDLSELANISLKDLEIEEIPADINWLEKSYRDFSPFPIGPFFIRGSHFDGDTPQDLIPLVVDAATAFGSGEHETTKGCMLAMLDLKNKGVCPWNILDMGTGSGILALAAWKLWENPVTAIDNDPECIRVTQRHAEMNDTPLNGSGLSTATGDGFNTPLAIKNKPYELILANILAGPVIEMAPALIRVLDDKGYCVLSGMLREQSDLVLSAYEGEGLTYKNRYDIGEWTTLVLQKI